ncbi:hypothetical protein KC354_g13229 [Hortaea werneckii]|nr:hypothetical protein KC354_g13229 [Hortaea werneckii]
MPFSLSSMDIQQAGLAASEEFLPRYTAQDSSPPPTYNDNTNNNAMTPPTNNEDLPPPSAQPEAPEPPSPAHLARCSRIAIFAQMIFHHTIATPREERLPTYESVDRLDRLSQRPMSPPPRRRRTWTRGRRSQWREYRAAIIIYLTVAVLGVVGVSLLAIYSNSLEAGEDGGMSEGRGEMLDGDVGREKM